MTLGDCAASGVAYVGTTAASGNVEPSTGIVAIVIAIAAPIVKDFIVSGGKWLFQKLFKKKEVSQQKNNSNGI